MHKRYISTATREGNQVLIMGDAGAEVAAKTPRQSMAYGQLQAQLDDTRALLSTVQRELAAFGAQHKQDMESLQRLLGGVTGVAPGMRCSPIGFLETVFHQKNGTPRQGCVCPGSSARLRIQTSRFTNPEVCGCQHFQPRTACRAALASRLVYVATARSSHRCGALEGRGTGERLWTNLSVVAGCSLAGPPPISTPWMDLGTFPMHGSCLNFTKMPTKSSDLKCGRPAWMESVQASSAHARPIGALRCCIS